VKRDHKKWAAANVPQRDMFDFRARQWIEASIPPYVVGVLVEHSLSQGQRALQDILDGEEVGRPT
jgi:hypothetical protein